MLSRSTAGYSTARAEGTGTGDEQSPVACPAAAANPILRARFPPAESPISAMREGSPPNPAELDPAHASPQAASRVASSQVGCPGEARRYSMLTTSQPRSANQRKSAAVSVNVPERNPPP